MRQLIRITSFVAFAAALTSACERKPAAPELQTTSGVQQQSQPLTIAGCLRSGATGETYVLTSTETDTTNPTSTFELIGHEGMKLGDYVGQRVEVSGTQLTDQRVTSTSGTTQQEPAKEASGTPAVSTKTELAVKRLDVSAIRPTGDRCDR